MAWIKLTTRKPEHKEEVICSDGKYVYYAEYNEEYKSFTLCMGIGITNAFKYDVKRITKWQPLPEV